MREEWEALEVEVGWGNGVEMMGAGEAVGGGGEVRGSMSRYERDV